MSKLSLDTLLKEHEKSVQPITEKQRDILVAAESLFAEVGFNGATTSEIARRAQVTEKTLFKYFPTKQDLLRSILFPIVLKTVFPMQIRRVRGLLSKEYESLEEFLTTMANDRLSAIRENSGKVRILVSEVLLNEKFRDQFTEIWVNEVWSDVLSTLNRLKKAGKIRKDISTETLARILIINMAGFAFFRFALRPNSQIDEEVEMKSIVQILVAGAT